MEAPVGQFPKNNMDRVECDVAPRFDRLLGALKRA